MLKSGAAAGGVRVAASGVQTLDGAGMAWLVWLRTEVSARGWTFELAGLDPAYERLLERFDAGGLRPASRRATRPEPLALQVGRTAWQVACDLRVHITFIGELTAALARAVWSPRGVRWVEVRLAAERTGADAVPIVGLICGLVGLVLGFQSAMAMRPYGAEIYTANLVTIAMLRELGPLMTAIILAGRSGAAYAAEIGTMKVNDEVAALSTMGLEPVAFLALPRVLGMTLTIPLLTLFGDGMGILGGALVFLSFDYPVSAYFDQALAAAEIRHLAGGLVKSVAFGVTVGGVGCLRGLTTLRGPSAVGMSATSAVVTAILMIVVIDAVLGTVFYFLGF
jgi:phospholipid/cholesterol/gamma-HCH transport system permease protein